MLNIFAYGHQTLTESGYTIRWLSRLTPLSFLTCHILMLNYLKTITCMPWLPRRAYQDDPWWTWRCYAGQRPVQGGVGGPWPALILFIIKDKLGWFRTRKRVHLWRGGHLESEKTPIQSDDDTSESSPKKKFQDRAVSKTSMARRTPGIFSEEEEKTPIQNIPIIMKCHSTARRNFSGGRGSPPDHCQWLCGGST